MRNLLPSVLLTGLPLALAGGDGGHGGHGGGNWGGGGGGGSWGGGGGGGGGNHGGGGWGGYPGYLGGYQYGWSPRDWNWGSSYNQAPAPYAGGSYGQQPHAQPQPPQNGGNQNNWQPHDACPAPASGQPPAQFPLQPLLDIHGGDQPMDSHWEQMCPRDSGSGALYHPVQCPNQGPKGCCTWRATATQVNGVWACCPCGAVCTGNAPGFGYQWTTGQPVPTPPGFTVPAPVTVTVTQAQPGPTQTVYPGVAPAPAPPPQGSTPTYCTYTTTSTGQTYTYSTMPPSNQGCVSPSASFITPTGPTGPMIWSSGSWITAPASGTGTHTAPVSACTVSNGKTTCRPQSTTQVSCSGDGKGGQACRTSSGPIVQTVNPAEKVGVPGGWAAAAMAGAMVVGGVVV